MKSTLSWAASALIASPYTTSPSERHLTFDHPLDRLRDIGESVRWWKGYERAGNVRETSPESETEKSVVYLEPPLPPSVRVLFSQTQEPLFTPTLSRLEAGTPTVAYLSHEIELAQGDIIVRTNHPIVSRCVLEP